MRSKSRLHWRYFFASLTILGILFHIDGQRRAWSKPSTGFLTQRAIFSLGWLRHYILLHSTCRRALLNRAKGIKSLVYECRGECGGVGDRLSGMIGAFYLAILTERVFIIDHTSPLPLNYTLVPNHINWDIAHLVASTSTSVTFRLIDKPYEEVCTQVFAAHDDNVDVIRLTLNTYALGREVWLENGGRSRCQGGMLRLQQTESEKRQYKSAAETFHLGFHALFKFSRPVKERAKEMQKAMGLFNSNGLLTPYVGVHARLGGTTQNSNLIAGWTDPERHKITDIHRFLSCASQHACAVGSPKCMSIVVLSDNQGFRSEISNLSSLIRYFAETTIVHVDRSIAAEHVMRRGNLDTFAELKILSQSVCIVGSESAFSAVGASISLVHHRSPCFVNFKQCDNSPYRFWESHGLR